MKNFLFSLIAILIALTIIPLFASGFGSETEKISIKNDVQSEKKSLEVNKPINTDTTSEKSPIADKTFKVLMKDSGEIIDMPVYDYLCGVVAAEMSATNNLEALKAQAVAAYTYSLYKMEMILKNPDIIPEHKGAYVCTDYTHCKAYLSKEDAKTKWGEKWFEKYYPNIEKAVSEVENKVILYNGKPINAVFHSMSSGKTEDAKDVWGSEIPYLKAVNSSFDTKAPLYESVILITFEEFREKMFNNIEGITFPDDVNQYISDIKRSDSGSIISMKICGNEIKGSKFREIFSLRSANFQIDIKEDGFLITVHGYGHGVGMSQYGANELAKEGKNYIEILKYYYKDVEISDYSWN